MLDSSSYTMRLSHEELLFLIDTLRVGQIPGVGPSPARYMTEDSARFTLSAGLNALLARDLVVIENNSIDKISVESVLVAYIHVCANARRLVQYTILDKKGGSTGGFVHITDDLLVTRWTPTPGVHQFCGTVDPGVVEQHLVSLLIDTEKLDDISEQPDCLEITLSMQEWKNTSDLIKANKPEKAISEFSCKGMPTKEAEKLAQDLSNVQKKIAFAYLSVPPNGAPDMDSWVAFSGDSKLIWLVTTKSPSQEASLVNIALGTSKRIRTKFREAIKPVLAHDGGEYRA